MARPPLERLPYFKFHPADYIIDTSGLSLAEHGAYTLLLLNYYWSGSLPASQNGLYSMCGAREEASRVAVDVVLDRFFHLEGGRMVHHRVERELAQYGEMIRTNQAAGRRSAEVRAAKRVLAPKQPSKPRTNGQHAPVSEEAFAAVWDAFPARRGMKKGKAKALASWKRINPDAELQARIMAAIAAQKGCHEWRKEGGAYVPDAFRWLDGKGWEAEVGPTQNPDRLII